MEFGPYAQLGVSGGPFGGIQFSGSRAYAGTPSLLLWHRQREIPVVNGTPCSDVNTNGDLGCCPGRRRSLLPGRRGRSEEHTSELQSHVNLVCRLLLEKKKYL